MTGFLEVNLIVIRFGFIIIIILIILIIKNKFPLFISPVFIALMLVGLSKCLKQIIQIELNRVKNPWTEANQSAIYKRGRGFELGTTESKSSSVAVRAGPALQPLGHAASDIYVHHHHHYPPPPPPSSSTIVFLENSFSSSFYRS